MLDTRKIPAINQGLEVLYKILRVSFFLVLVQNVISLLPYANIHLNISRGLGIPMLGVLIYILVDTFRAFNLLIQSAVSVQMTEQVIKAKNYLTYSLIAAAVAVVLFIMLYSGSFFSESFLYIFFGIVLVTFVLNIVHVITTISVSSSVGTDFKNEKILSESKKTLNIYIVNICILALNISIEVGPQLGIFPPLGQTISMIIDFLSSCTAIYFAYSYYSLFKLNVEELEVEYSKGTVIGQEPTESIDIE